MAAWAGFSDADLQRLKEISSQEEKNKNVKAAIAMKSSNLKLKPKASTVERLLQRGSHTAPSPSISSSQRLSQPKPTSLPIPNHAGHAGIKIPRDRVQTVSSNSVSESNITSSNMETEDSNIEMFMIKEEIDPVELDAETALNREMGNLDKFRESQKHMEEANKQRKALLAKTLNERQRKAREEAEKLAHIQKELHKLDNLLSADVTVIRSRIEIASRYFLDAQKRYERAEREFVEAKMDLQSKSELKEQLTEHLYTIIHQNEVRKSKKLAELMKELEMEASDDCVQLPDLPPLATFNTVNPVQTIHSPKSPVGTTPGKSKKESTDLSSEKNPEKSTSQEKQASDCQSEKSDKNSEVASSSKDIDSSNQISKSDSDAADLGTSSENNKSKDLINFSPSKTVTENSSELPNNEPQTEAEMSKNKQDETEKTDNQIDLSQTLHDDKDISQCDNTESQSTSVHPGSPGGETNSNLNVSDLQNYEENSQGSNSAESTSGSVSEIPDSWTLNLLNIKKEPDS